jgi:hypothetical protein
MTVTIRKLDKSEHEYFAYTKSICGKATYFLYFEDSIWGAITLHNFIEMLKSFFQQKNVDVRIDEKSIPIKNKYILELIKE